MAGVGLAMLGLALCGALAHGTRGYHEVWATRESLWRWVVALDVRGDPGAINQLANALQFQGVPRTRGRHRHQHQ